MGSVPTAAFTVGDSVPLDPREPGPNRIRTPHGELLPLVAGSASFDATTEPGVYAVESAVSNGGTPRVLRRFAVNVDPQESRTQPMPLETLERYGAPSIVVADRPATEAPPAIAGALAAIEAEAQQKLWKWCLSAAFALAVLETALAALSARRALAPRDGLQSSNPVPS